MYISYKSLFFLIDYLNSIDDLCSQYLGGMIPCLANIAATVSPYLFFNNGLCYNNLGGMILWVANSIAAVYP